MRRPREHHRLVPRDVGVRRVHAEDRIEEPEGEHRDHGHGDDVVPSRGKPADETPVPVDGDNHTPYTLAGRAHRLLRQRFVRADDDPVDLVAAHPGPEREPDETRPRADRTAQVAAHAAVVLYSSISLSTPKSPARSSRSWLISARIRSGSVLDVVRSRDGLLDQSLVEYALDDTCEPVRCPRQSIVATRAAVGAAGLVWSASGVCTQRVVVKQNGFGGKPFCAGSCGPCPLGSRLAAACRRTTCTERLADVLDSCRLEQRLAPTTCSAYEREVVQPTPYLRNWRSPR